MREADAVPRKRVLLILRYVLILAAGSFGLIRSDLSALLVSLAVCLVLLSNVVLARISAISFFSELTQSLLLLVDTVLVSGILVLSSVGPTPFLLFFSVLILAAYVENLVLLGVAAGLIGTVGSAFFGLEKGALQVIFMVVAAEYYGFLVLPERAGEWVERIGVQKGGLAERYVLTLFVAGRGPESMRAFAAVKAMCDKYLEGRYVLSVVDVTEDPERARRLNVFATPTLVKERPGVVRRHFGEFSRAEKLVDALGLVRSEES